MHAYMWPPPTEEVPLSTDQSVSKNKRASTLFGGLGVLRGGPLRLLVLPAPDMVIPSLHCWACLHGVIPLQQLCVHRQLPQLAAYLPLAPYLLLMTDSSLSALMNRFTNLPPHLNPSSSSIHPGRKATRDIVRSVKLQNEIEQAGHSYLVHPRVIE